MAEFITVAKLEDLEPEKGYQVSVNGNLISLWNLDGEIYAIGDICTHEEEYLSEGELVDHCCVECPLHGAQFDVRTGAVMCLPATEPVVTYPVRVVGNEVQVEV